MKKAIYVLLVTVLLISFATVTLSEATPSAEPEYYSTPQIDINIYLKLWKDDMFVWQLVREIELYFHYRVMMVHSGEQLLLTQELPQMKEMFDVPYINKSIFIPCEDTSLPIEVTLDTMSSLLIVYYGEEVIFTQELPKIEEITDAFHQ